MMLWAETAVETTDLRCGGLVIGELGNEEKQVLGGVGGSRYRDKLR